MNTSPEKIYIDHKAAKRLLEFPDTTMEMCGAIRYANADISYIRADIMKAKIKDKEDEIQLYKQSFETAFILWESMATAGQLTINQKFNEVYDQLLKIKNL